MSGTKKLETNRKHVLGGEEQNQAKNPQKNKHHRENQNKQTTKKAKQTTKQLKNHTKIKPSLKSPQGCVMQRGEAAFHV